MTTVHWRWLAVILVVAGLLRLPAVIVDPVVSADEASFLRLAEAAPAHPEVLTLHNYHPGWPTLLVPVVWMAGDTPERAARMLSLLLGLVSVVCCFGFARERFGPRAALAAAALMALHPGPVESGGHILSESLYVPALLGACWALMRLLMKGGVGAAAAFGVLTGIAYLTRQEGLAPAVLGLGWMAAGGPMRAGDGAVSWSRRLGLLGVGVLSLAVVAAPYMASIGGISRKKALGIAALDASPDRQAASAALTAISPTWIGNSDVHSGERAPVSEFLHEWFSSPTPLFWLLALAGAVWLVRRRFRPRYPDVALIGVIAVYLAAHVFLLSKAGYLSSRHVWPVAALAFPWLGAALAQLTLWRPVSRPWAGPAATAVGLATLLVMGGVAAGWPWSSNRGYLREAGQMLRAEPGEPGAVLATDSRVAYYGRIRPIIIGNTTWAGLLDAGRTEGARFVACEARILAARAEGFDPESPSGVRLLREIPMPARRGRPPGRFLVFEILGN